MASDYIDRDINIQVCELDKEEYAILTSRPQVSDNFPLYLNMHPSNIRPENMHWVPQGGALAEAELGVSQLVDEILINIHATEMDRWKVLVFVTWFLVFSCFTTQYDLCRLCSQVGQAPLRCLPLDRSQNGKFVTSKSLLYPVSNPVPI